MIKETLLGMTEEMTEEMTGNVVCGKKDIWLGTVFMQIRLQE